jgi:peptidoglycan/LPS O-acetylase OafA/YrhL
VTSAPVRTARRDRAHLHEVDVVRLVTFGCVILVHAVAFTTAGSSVPAGAVTVLVHFTREAFFFLSAFVLFHATGDRTPRLRSFWARRFFAIGVPYLVWTVGYWLLYVRSSALSASSLRALAFDVGTGTASYHLYFLVVSMQLYLVFPVLLRLVRRTAGHHRALFAGSLVMQLAVLSLLQWTHPHGGFWGGLQASAYVLLPTYQFYFVAGALAAVHRERFRRWVVGHRATVAGVVVGTALLAEAAYAAQLLAGSSSAGADTPLQPVMVLWSTAVTVGIYALGCGYAARRRGGRFARAVEQASLASFGVYLIHPLVLQEVRAWWLTPAHIPPPVSTLLAWVCTLLISFAIVALVLRTPAAFPLTGRHRVRRTRDQRPVPAAVLRAPGSGSSSGPRRIVTGRPARSAASRWSRTRSSAGGDREVTEPASIASIRTGSRP